MASTFKRRIAHGFTLIELLIVVIILAIIAAIAIPQFSASTSDAQLAALDSNLSAVRTALEQYKLQHSGNVYPGAKTSTGGSCTNGATAMEGEAESEAAMLAQLKGYSNAAGQVCSGPDENFKYGPYLRQGLPMEPINNLTSIAISKTAAMPDTSKGTGGWAYSIVTGKFVMNSDAEDSNKIKYSAH